MWIQWEIKDNITFNKVIFLILVFTPVSWLNPQVGQLQPAGHRFDTPGLMDENPRPDYNKYSIFTLKRVSYSSVQQLPRRQHLKES